MYGSAQAPRTQYEFLASDVAESHSWQCTGLVVNQILSMAGQADCWLIVCWAHDASQQALRFDMKLQAFHLPGQHALQNEPHLAVIAHAPAAPCALEVLTGIFLAGKTYIGTRLVQVLVNNTQPQSGLPFSKAMVGPILVLTYTNHALDQFLEDLIEHGIESIVRMGGNSKSTILEPYNFRHMNKNYSKRIRERRAYLRG